MRTLVLVLMIALLPVRVWAGEAMAVRMAGVPAPASHVMAEMPEDCPMMQAAAQTAQGDDSASTPSPGCKVCQLCAPLGLFTSSPIAHEALPPEAIAPIQTSFTSAEPRRHHRPPIA